MEDVLGVYERAFDPTRPLVCLDEAAKQILSEVREPLPVAPGHAGRFDHEYKREGTAALFMLFGPLLGRAPRLCPGAAHPQGLCRGHQSPCR